MMVHHFSHYYSRRCRRMMPVVAIVINPSLVQQSNDLGVINLETVGSSKTLEQLRGFYHGFCTSGIRLCWYGSQNCWRIWRTCSYVFHGDGRIWKLTFSTVKSLKMMEFFSVDPTVGVKDLCMNMCALLSFFKTNLTYPLWGMQGLRERLVLLMAAWWSSYGCNGLWTSCFWAKEW